MKLNDWWQQAKAAERNALIAEKAMGITDFRKDWLCYISPDDGTLVPWLEEWGEFTEGERDRDLFTERGLFFRNEYDVLEAVPDYQGNIADAWQVALQMRKNNWGLCLRLRKDHAEASFVFVPTDEAHITQHTRWIPGPAEEAICLAALEALGIEEVG